MIVIKDVMINTDTIELDKFLKWAGALPTGGVAKHLIKMGEVAVNGQVETRRSKKLFPGDIVEIEGQRYRVVKEPKQGES